VKSSNEIPIVGTGLVGKTLAGIFARQGMRALIANSRGPESLAEIAAELGPHIIPKHNLAVTPLLLAATIDRILFSLPHSIRNYAFLNASDPEW
jgi:predicted dinucleotide-binding enzyme